MPQLGESITEGTVIRWNKKVGDTVARDEPLFEISTDKVDAEIPSPSAGIVAEIRVGEGETVPVDTVVALIEQSGDKAAEPVTEGASSSSSTPPPSLDEVAEVSVDPARHRDGPRGQSSPVVRRLAREHRIDIEKIRGTGAGGRVTKADVMKRVHERASRKGRVEPMSVMRQQIAERMVNSRRTAAHVHTVFDVDFSHVAALRAKRKASPEGKDEKLTYLAFVAHAVTRALAEVPIVNARLDDDDIVYSDDVNVGVAVALDWGLIVPVVQRAQSKTLLELSEAIADLSERARAKRLQPADVVGGTFTITNPGVFGSVIGTPIINQPQLAILCVGAVEKRPVVSQDAVVVQTRAFLTLGFDHRVIDGAMADRFMGIVKHNLEQFDDALIS
jgi:pyruvate dehydrogenase E2 component (dihydrolipoamide acetyltransferase)